MADPHESPENETPEEKRLRLLSLAAVHTQDEPKAEKKAGTESKDSKSSTKEK